MKASTIAPALFAATMLAMSPSDAIAGPLAVTSYDMPNGDGTAAGGSFNYWDKFYSGSGATTVDGAPLSGGKGDLTDGIVSSQPWYLVENTAGDGPYVGWYKPATANPVVTFHLAGPSTVTDIAIHLDNSNVGGVFAPQAILVDGISQAFTAPAAGTVGWVDLSGLHLTGGSHSIEFDQAFSAWTFVDEVSFNGTPGVPEPATWSLLIAGFGMSGASLRRRRRAIA